MAKQISKEANRLLEGAYAIESAQDNISYYKEFAPLYDTEFADSLGYVYPQMLAEAYSRHALLTDPDIADREITKHKIADIGCGTGLVAQALRDHAALNNISIDGLDISPDMLVVAEAKGLYQNLIQADLTKSVPATNESYTAVLSAGTFTFGHLGPEILPALLALGRSNTLYCIGVNSEHYEQQGFAKVFNTMVKQNLITSPVLETQNIYAPSGTTRQSSRHANDVATVVVYRQV